MRRKKENEFSFYTRHKNQLLSEVLLKTALFVSKKIHVHLRPLTVQKNLVHPVIQSKNIPFWLLFWHFGVQRSLFDVRYSHIHLRPLTVSKKNLVHPVIQSKNIPFWLSVPFAVFSGQKYIAQSFRVVSVVNRLCLFPSEIIFTLRSKEWLKIYRLEFSCVSCV